VPVLAEGAGADLLPAAGADDVTGDDATSGAFWLRDDEETEVNNCVAKNIPDNDKGVSISNCLIKFVFTTLTKGI
jgi:hypothetical protein